MTPLSVAAGGAFAWCAVESGVVTPSGFCHRTPKRGRDSHRPRRREASWSAAAVTPLLVAGGGSFAWCDVKSGVASPSGLCHRSPKRCRDSCRQRRREAFWCAAAVTPLSLADGGAFARRAVKSGVVAPSGLCHRTPKRCRNSCRPAQARSVLECGGCDAAFGGRRRCVRLVCRQKRCRHPFGVLPPHSKTRSRGSGSHFTTGWPALFHSFMPPSR